MRHLYLVLMILWGCSSSEKRQNSFSFELNGKKFNSNWQNVTENGEQYAVECSDTQYHFGIIFNKSNWYGKPHVELSKNGIEDRYLIDSSFDISSKSNGNGYEGYFSGNIINNTDTIRITNGRFIIFN